MTGRHKIIVVVASLVAGAVIVGGTLFVTKPKDGLRKVTQAELKQSDGKDGRPCYVALSGEVYEIKQSLYWKEGKHTESMGQAYCGADLTDVLPKSPHGSTIMSLLTKIGPLR